MIRHLRLNVRRFRKCIHAMTDQQLVGFGRACRSLCVHANSDGERPSEAIYRSQFEQCREEWSLRHPKMV
jgi:hypothetical protein